MAIPAKRFSSLDIDTNLGFVDVTKITNTDIYNSAANELQLVTKNLDELMMCTRESLVSPTQEAIAKVKEATGSLVRNTRDVLSGVEDLTKWTPQRITKEIADMIPDSTVRNMFENLSKECRNKALGQRPGFKPFKDNLRCGSPKDGHCSTDQVNGLLGKATGGLLGQITQTIGKALKSLWALATLGFEAGACKIFGALIKGLPDNAVQRGAAFLLGTQGASGNTAAVLDIATNMGIGRNGIFPSLEIPNLVGTAISNFRKPIGYSDSVAYDYTDGYFMAMDEIQPDWKVSNEDGILSMASIGSGWSGEMNDMLGAGSSGFSMGSSGLDAIVKNPIQSFAGAYNSMRNGVSTLESLGDWF